jgi:hypothetical protein
MSGKITPLEMLEALREQQAELEGKIGELQTLKNQHANILAAIGTLERLINAMPPAQTINVPSTATAGPVVAPMNISVVRMTAAPRTLVEAAERALEAAKRPLHIKEIVEAIQAAGFNREKTYEQVRTSLVPSLNRLSNENDRFFKVANQPVYGLAAWNPEA